MQKIWSVMKIEMLHTFFHIVKKTDKKNSHVNAQLLTLVGQTPSSFLLGKAPFNSFFKFISISNLNSDFMS